MSPTCESQFSYMYESGMQELSQSMFTMSDTGCIRRPRGDRHHETCQEYNGGGVGCACFAHGIHWEGENEIEDV